MQSKRSRKCLFALLAIPALVGFGIGLDVASSGSIYYPVTYIYTISSWLLCKFTSSPVCDENRKKAVVVPVQNNVVVTSQSKASEIGLRILEEGGNAIDAAVAVGYALAVTEPCCGNVGGGGFMLIHQAKGKNIFLDFRERAPLAANPTMYLDKQGNLISGLSTKGYLAVGVPGTVLGLNQALSKYGTMSRERVMAPAIELAQKGFILQPGDVRFLRSKTKEFSEQSNVADIFLKDGKTPYQVGDRLVQQDLARTLKLIANQGSEAFYKGPIASQLVKASSEHHGILTREDLANYTVKQRQPLKCSYRGYEIISAPPPGGGTTLCEMLNILNGYPLSKLGFHSPNSLHYELEAMLHAYADRNRYLADPDFVKNPVERLISQEYAAHIRTVIPERRATSPQPLKANQSNEGTNTTHYSIIDRYGNAVAVTYTLNSLFGAKVIAGTSGFFLNDEMDDFTSMPGAANNFGLVQGNANSIAPGKRPLSSMTPTIVLNKDKVFIVTGSPGGSTITTTVLQVISNVIDFGMDIQSAVDAPRIHYQGQPNFVVTEPYALKPNVIKDLWEMGYQVIPFIPWGAAESIDVDPQTKLLYGANDIRRPAGAATGN